MEDNNQSKNEIISYFKSVNNESSITILPGDVANLNLITTSELYEDNISFLNNDLSYITQNIYFNYNSAIIPELGVSQLEKLATFLKDNKNVKVNVSCYTDSRGDMKYNNALSEKRGNNIRLYLLSKGIVGERIIVDALGEKNPVFDCEKIVCDDDKHAKNRRAELKIIWN